MPVSTMGLTQDKTIPPFLNDPAATARGMTINSIGADNISVTTNPSDSRRAYAVPAPPAGSLVSFGLVTSASFYLRLDDENGFDTPTLNIWSTTTAGTFRVEVVVPVSKRSSLLGFQTAASAANIRITNWRVTRP